MLQISRVRLMAASGGVDYAGEIPKSAVDVVMWGGRAYTFESADTGPDGVVMGVFTPASAIEVGTINVPATEAADLEAAIAENLEAEPQLQYFRSAHLPERLAAVSRPFGLLAVGMVTGLRRNAERSAGRRKILEAKDCAVRAELYIAPQPSA